MVAIYKTSRPVNEYTTHEHFGNEWFELGTYLWSIGAVPSEAGEYVDTLETAEQQELVNTGFQCFVSMFKKDMDDCKV